MAKEKTRKQVAKALAHKDGLDWDALDDYGKHSYLHYADVVISKRLPVPKEPVKEKPAPRQKPETVPKGQFWCSKCNALHRETSTKGKRHLKYAADRGKPDDNPDISGAGRDN